MINFYLAGVFITFVLMIISLRLDADDNSELGRDIAFAAFSSVLWPFALLVILLSPYV